MKTYTYTVLLTTEYKPRDMREWLEEIINKGLQEKEQYGFNEEVAQVIFNEEGQE